MIKRKLTLIALLLLTIIALFRTQRGINHSFLNAPECTKTSTSGPAGTCNPSGPFAVLPTQLPKMQPRQLAGTLGIDPGRSVARGSDRMPKMPQTTTSDAQSTSDFIDQDQVIVHLNDR